MTNKHLNLEEDVRRLVEAQEGDLAFRAICQGDQEALRELSTKGSIQSQFDPLKEPQLGPAQREALLTFVLEEEVARALEDTQADNIVYDQLGEHRILGRVKKKKKPSSPSYP
jgi:hypothetical protein